MSLTERLRTAYHDLRTKDATPAPTCSQSCLCHDATKWLSGDPFAGLPAAKPWTPEARR